MNSSTTRILYAIVFLLSISLATSIWVKQEIFNELTCEDSSSMGGTVYLSDYCNLGTNYTCDIDTGIVYLTEYDTNICSGSLPFLYNYTVDTCYPSSQADGIATTQYTCYTSFPGYPQNSIVTITYIGESDNIVAYSWLPANKCYKDWYNSYDSSDSAFMTGSGSIGSGSGSGLSENGLVFGEPTFGNPSLDKPLNNGNVGTDLYANFVLNKCTNNETYTVNTYYNKRADSSSEDSGGTLSTGSYSSGYPVAPTGSGQLSASGGNIFISRNEIGGGEGSVHGGCSITPESSWVIKLSTSLYPIGHTLYAKKICILD